MERLKCEAGKDLLMMKHSGDSVMAWACMDTPKTRLLDAKTHDRAKLNSGGTFVMLKCIRSNWQEVHSGKTMIQNTPLIQHRPSSRENVEGFTLSISTN